MIEELAQAGPEHLDPGFVSGYDRKQGAPDPAQDLAEFVVHGLTQDALHPELRPIGGSEL